MDQSRDWSGPCFIISASSLTQTLTLDVVLYDAAPSMTLDGRGLMFSLYWTECRACFHDGLHTELLGRIAIWLFFNDYNHSNNYIFVYSHNYNFEVNWNGRQRRRASSTKSLDPHTIQPACSTRIPSNQLGRKTEYWIIIFEILRVVKEFLIGCVGLCKQNTGLVRLMGKQSDYINIHELPPTDVRACNSDRMVDNGHKIRSKPRPPQTLRGPQAHSVQFPFEE